MAARLKLVDADYVPLLPRTGPQGKPQRKVRAPPRLDLYDVAAAVIAGVLAAWICDL
jgi:hypothetical protein